MPFQNFLKKVILLFTAFILLGSQPSFAALSLRIKNSEVDKTRILIAGFKSNDPKIENEVSMILDQIRENLNSTALFEVTTTQDPRYFSLSSDSMPQEKAIAIDKVPDFNKYRTLGVDALLIGDLKYNPIEDKLEVKVRLWDMLDEKQLFGKYYSTVIEKHKKIANLISDKVFENITGEKSGHFDTQIVYIAESGSELHRVKRIAIMDFDGKNNRYLTDGRELVLTPIFSKKSQEIFFLRYLRDKPQIFCINLSNETISKLSQINKTTFAPSVHPTNPNLLLFSVIENGNSNIYEINRYTDTTSKLTNNNSINTTPSYSPDGKKIVFSSDRSGTEKIYIMNYDGTNLHKIGSGSGSYSKPVWSPDGSLIAFTRISNNRFSIGIMTPDGDNERTITSSYLVEGARWSPNGRYLIYSKKLSAYGKNSIPKLYMIDIVTEYERMLPTPANEGASDPDWGPSWQK